MLQQVEMPEHWTAWLAWLANTLTRSAMMRRAIVFIVCRAPILPHLGLIHVMHVLPALIQWMQVRNYVS